jgi:hypothetical protein
MLEGRRAHVCVDVVIKHRRCLSSPETVLIVPGQGIGIGPLPDTSRCVDRATMKRVVVLAVVKLLPDASADLEAQIGRDRYIACVNRL